MDKYIEVKNFGKIGVMDGKNPRQLHPYQIDAVKSLDELNRSISFASMLVLPTGGGKTLTAVWWLLRAALDNDKKVLWLAHRNLLLDQAFFTFAGNSFTEVLPSISSYKYRIVSGSHDKAVNIENDDRLLIVGKDSMIRNLPMLDKWLEGEEEIYFVIDEAHHAAARSYRRIISYVTERVERVKMLGLTATPFRTNESENGLLRRIFTDDIAYKINLADLIKEQYLSKPFTEEYSTALALGENLGARELKTIENLDSLPENIMEEIASNSARNRLIVNTYLKNAKKYGKTIIFALNRTHALVLNSLFHGEGVDSGVVISGVSSDFTDIDISEEENERNIEAYKNGNLMVLINVNILTEGVDVPETQTVFLTRPTVSTVLMTQMIGRALRGVKAGGTENAYIVSFIDDWNTRIAWVSPESLLENETEPDDKKRDYFRKELRKISIAKLEEFARIADSTVDTSSLENIDFIERIPTGMYYFNIIENGIERSHRILVYNSTEKQYEDMLSGLPALFEAYGIDDEDISERIGELCEVCNESYFYDDMFPVYDPRDVEALLLYYAQKECLPEFIAFDDMERKKLDISVIARGMIDKGLNIVEQYRYIDSLWNDKDNMLAVFFGKKDYFVSQLTNEIQKLIYGETKQQNIIPGKRSYEKLTMRELREADPEYESQLRRKIFESARKEPEGYVCRICGYTSRNKVFFHVDHIIPHSKGGLTREDNLQLLCRNCNRKKGDKLIELPQDKDYDKMSLEELRTLAEKDDNDAVWTLALRYYNGTGVKCDYELAIEYFERAADYGDTAALNFIGVCYHNIHGLRNKYKKAFEYYKMAADAGEAWGWLNMGACYEDGKGVPEKDLKKALEYSLKGLEMAGDDDYCVEYAAAQTDRIRKKLKK